MAGSLYSFATGERLGLHVNSPVACDATAYAVWEE
jgi:hypothetical protein